MGRGLAALSAPTCREGAAFRERPSPFSFFFTFVTPLPERPSLFRQSEQQSRQLELFR